MEKGDDRIKIVVIGGVACGPKAAAKARRCDADAEITIVEKGDFISYAGCGMPYYIAGAVKKIEGLMMTPSGAVRDVEFFKDVKGITVRTNTFAQSIDRKKREVVLVDMKSGQMEAMSYDKLVLATGSSAVVPPIEGVGMKNVFTLHNLNDAAAIFNYIVGSNAGRVVIVGGGLIGLEAADAMGAQGVDTTIIEMMPHLLPQILDLEMSDYLAAAMRKEGVNVLTSAKVLKIEGDSDGTARKVITDKGEVETDFVILAIGVRPNTELAAAAGLQIGETGAIYVNEYLQTSDPDIFAGGDCVECTHSISGRKAYIPLGSIANRHGRIIGTNVTGGRETFPGVIGTTVLKTMGMNVGRTGLSEAQARNAGYSTVACISPSVDRAHFFPGGRGILIKLVAEEGSGKLLGAQIIGQGDMSKRIDVVAAALAFGASVEDMAKLDLGYAPPYSTAMDCIAHSANIIRNKFDNTANSITAAEVRDKISRGERFTILDVRSPVEVEKNRVNDGRVKNIPLDKLRQMMNELPKDGEIVTLCQAGLRAYEAQVMLRGAGFSDVRFIDGGMALWE
ncbi:MAG: FAD-dependent oxidoreductase [bacterium]